MKIQHKLILTGCLLIIIFDVSGWIAANRYHISYGYLAVISFIIYAVFGFLATKHIDLKYGMFIAAAVGLFDGTIGWGVITLLKTNAGEINDLNLLVRVVGIILVTLLAAIAGLVGGALGRWIKISQ